LYMCAGIDGTRTVDEPACMNCAQLSCQTAYIEGMRKAHAAAVVRCSFVTLIVSDNFICRI
jgi:hypothetical protein